VTQRLEDRIAGIEGIRYIQSSSRDGRSSITVEFNLNRDIDAAANDIREAVSSVVRFLPDEVDPPQVTKADADADPILWLNLSSTTMDNLELSDYARRYLVDRLSVVDGVALVRLGGAKALRDAYLGGSRGVGGARPDRGRYRRRPASRERRACRRAYRLGTVSSRFGSIACTAAPRTLPAW
jgi:hypothetical protein